MLVADVVDVVVPVETVLPICPVSRHCYHRIRNPISTFLLLTLSEDYNCYNFWSGLD